MEIGFYRAADRNRLQEITNRSFLLNSFNVDSHLPRMLKGEVFFETMASRAMTENSSSCLVARIRGNPVGYIIHAIDKKLSELFDIRTGTIILFCVAREAQGKGVGRALLKKSLSLLKARDVRLITVGTDGNNIAALKLYQDAGFRTRMNWGTFRYYPSFQQPEIPPGPRVVPYAGEKGMERISRFTERPISFFTERLIHPRNLVALRKDVIQKVVHGIESGTYHTMLAWQGSLLGERIVGLLTYEEESSIQRFFNRNGSPKPIYRINDLVTMPRQRDSGVGTRLLAEFLNSARDYHFAEIWVAMDNWPLLNVLAKCHFRIAHLATVLHYSE